MAEAAQGEGKAEGAETPFSIPADLSLLYFHGRDELADCTVRLPAPPGEEGAEVKCHRLALCSTCGFFFRSFLQPAEVPSSAELPALPDDAELRRQMPVRALFQQMLRFAYAAQRWEALEGEVSAAQLPGLWALSVLLEARALKEASYGRLEKALSPGSAAGLLYISQLLKSNSEGSEDFQRASSRCLEVVRSGFGALCESPPSLGLLCKLPVDLLVELLEDDKLEVRTEGSVLQAVRHTLWRRLRRAGRLLKLSGRLCQAPALFATEGLQLAWELILLEASQTDPLAAAAPPVDRFSAGAAAPAAESAPGEGAPLPDLTLRLPGDLAPSALLRAKKDSGEVVLAALLSLENLPEGEESSSERTAQAVAADGTPAGNIRFTWTLSEAPAEEVPEEKEEDAKEEGDGEGATEAKAPQPRGPDALLTEEEVRRLLATVRFSHLEHKDLLGATRDPLLTEAGAQQHVLSALSSRLSHYEAVEGAASTAPPRPSTLRRAPPGPPGAPAPPPMEEEPAATSPMRSTLGRGNTPLGVSGVSLFPCDACSGQGRMQLRHVGDRWCARCNRHASCGNTLWLPTCVVAAAVDGYCAPCALRVGAEVRTLSVRIGRDQQQTLLRLPAGTDTLRGMCVAGCHNLLSLLGG